MKIFNTFFIFLLAVFFGGQACKNKGSIKSPDGYDLSRPEKFVMNSDLHEISGICFIEGKDDLYAIEDEDGKLYSIPLPANTATKWKFGKKGDYEDVTAFNNQVFVLRSDGSIYAFPFASVGQADEAGVQEYKHLLPAGEYEGLANADDNLYALCKDCPNDKSKKEVSVYVINGDTSGLKISSNFKIDISSIEEKAAKEKFNPSALAKHPLTKEWFILSSVNKLLLVLDDQWKVKASYPLDPALFNQPEGIAFNKNGDLYISNEGGVGSGNVLLFKYTSTK